MCRPQFGPVLGRLPEAGERELLAAGDWQSGRVAQLARTDGARAAQKELACMMPRGQRWIVD